MTLVASWAPIKLTPAGFTKSTRPAWRIKTASEEVDVAVPLLAAQRVVASATAVTPMVRHDPKILHPGDFIPEPE
jgi:hypothetical protein